MFGLFLTSEERQEALNEEILIDLSNLASFLNIFINAGTAALELREARAPNRRELALIDGLDMGFILFTHDWKR